MCAAVCAATAVCRATGSVYSICVYHRTHLSVHLFCKMEDVYKKERKRGGPDTARKKRAADAAQAPVTPPPTNQSQSAHTAQRQPKLSRSGSSCSSGGRAGQGFPAGRPCASGRGWVTSGAAGRQPEGTFGGEGGKAARRALLAREVADPGEANHHEVQRAEVALHVRRQQVVDHPALRPLPGFSSELVHGLGLREARRHHRLASGRARL